MALLIIDKYHLEEDFTDLFNQVFKIVKNKLNINNDYDLSVTFIDDETIRNINRDYRFIDQPTDVISFAMLDNEDLVAQDSSNLDLGDIFISIDTAHKQALRLNQSLKRELTFLFIHGLLHLLGYDHQNEDDELKMFKLQREILDEVIEAHYNQI